MERIASYMIKVFFQYKIVCTFDKKSLLFSKNKAMALLTKKEYFSSHMQQLTTSATERLYNFQDALILRIFFTSSYFLS